MPIPHRRRRGGAPARAVAALLGLVLPLCGAVAAPVAAVAAPGAVVTEDGTLLLEEDFSGTSVDDPRYVVGGAREGGGSPWTPCLTAGSTDGEGPVPGCDLPLPDAPGRGVLRLTPAENGTSGFVLYDQELPVRAGLDITFTSHQWGGNGADGISFFLADGDRPLTRPGGFGGALGYSNRNDVPGVSGALLGVGLDAYGNWPLEPSNGDCRAPEAWVPPAGSSAADFAGHVSVRGPGDGFRGYCLLGEPVRAEGLRAGGRTRPGAVTTRIVVDPPGRPSPRVVVEVDGSRVADVPLPAVDARTFRFGWGSSTGGLTDVHEIGSLSVRTVDPLGPDLALRATVPTGVAASGVGVPVELTATTRPTGGPLAAGERADLVADLPGGTAAGTPAGDGWDCAASTTSRVACSWTGPQPVRPGTDLPPLVVPVTSSRSGTSRVLGTVTSPAEDPRPVTDGQASATLRWAPGLAAVDLGETDASSAPTTTSAPLVTDAVGPVQVSSVGPRSAVGEVRAGTVAELLVTPDAGASGVLRGTAVVTDGEGTPSPGAPVTLVVRPVAPPLSGEVAGGGTTEIVPPAPPVGTGPFRFELLSSGDPRLVDEASIDPATGVLRVRAATGTSGRTSATYRVVDAEGVAGRPAAAVVDVRPAARDDAVRLPVAADGRGAAELPLPEPAGSGPFRYELLGTDGPVTAALDPASGVLALAAVPGRSGVAHVRYAVTGADGVESRPAVVRVALAPHVRGATAQGLAVDRAVVAPAPRTTGTGPFTFALGGVTPGASAVVDPATGAVSLDPHGRSGRYVVAVTATDADGVTSDAAAVEVTVLPVARDLRVRVVASPTPAEVRVPVEVVGAEEAEVAVDGTPAGAPAEVRVDGADLVVTPVAGASGRVEVAYRASVDGLGSAPARLLVEVAPRGYASSAVAVAGRRTEVSLPTPEGTGPFVLRAVGPVDADLPVALHGSTVELAPAVGRSGPAVVRYLVVDRDGVAGDPVELAVDVRPDALTGTGPLVATGVAGRRVLTPTPRAAGTGPFAFFLVEAVPAALGSTALDPATGVVALDPAPGWSGVALARFAVRDGLGATSDPAEAVFVVRPVAPDAPTVSTVAGTAVEVALPPPVGTGPFRWSLVTAPPAGQGTADLDPTTGRLVVRPAAGHAGPLAYAYAVTDAAGLVSDPAAGVVEVTAAPAEPPGDPETPTTPPTPPTPLPSPPPTGPSVVPSPPVGGPTTDAVPVAGPASRPTTGAATGRPTERLPRTGGTPVVPLLLGLGLLAAGVGLRRHGPRGRRA